MSDLVAIVNGLVGRPWDPPAFDCWAFLAMVYRHAYGIELVTLEHVAGDEGMDQIFGVAEASSGRWLPIATPDIGDAVAMGRRGAAYHCGIWMGSGAIAHCSQPLGVAVCAQRSLQSLGWGSFKFYRHRDRVCA